MLHKTTRGCVITALIIIAASGCATSARVDSMQVAGTPTQRIEQTPLRGSVGIHDVTGGRETNPMWTSQVSSSGFREALESSLKNVGLFSPYQMARYRLTAHLADLKQPLIGISMTVTAHVQYDLHEVATGTTIYSRSIELPYTAAFGDSLLGPERLRLANEGAVRVNVKALLDDLFALSIDKEVVSVTK